MEFADTFKGLTELREVSMIGTAMGTLPDMTGTDKLTRLDVRSSQLTNLPVMGLVSKEVSRLEVLAAVTGQC